jgi:hydroxymethylglutaryl-CoA reductase (NADPH)
MSAPPLTHGDPARAALDLVPRLSGPGYGPADLIARREWVRARTGAGRGLVGAFAVPPESMRGNIENPIGAAQIPLGIAGPLLVHGEHATGTFYIPLATTEGALVRSYERGMAALTRAGGVTVRVVRDENLVCPVFLFDDVADACTFARRLPDDLEALRVEAESTTRHGRLLRVECILIGREVIVHFVYHTADAQGMNMIVKATDRACRWAAGAHPAVRRYYLFSGHSSEKRASGALFGGGKGKTVVAGALLPAAVCRAYLHATPAQLCDDWHRTVLGHVAAHAVGYNAHLANGLAAIFIACGQAVANVANAAVGVTNFDLTDAGDLYASVTLPALTVGTVGGGTGLGTGRECLEVLGCAGPGRAARFAEIVAAALLAGELSMGGGIASDEFVAAHEAYGRNRPAVGTP